MNREIKFRVFDKGDRRMKYTDIEYFDDMIGFRFEHRYFEQDDNSDIVLMQYIRLKDKKGKEIYEGDIVQLFSCKRPIVFNNGGFGYYTEMDNGEFIFLGSNRHFEWKENQSDKIKVVGNIYETPHLLNSEQSVKESNTTNDK